MKIIQKCLDGKGGYAYLTNNYGMKDGKQIEDWVKAYKEFGEEGLLRKRKNQKYSVQFKLDVKRVK